jgi:flagellin
MTSAVVGNSDTNATVNFNFASLDGTGGATTTLTKNTTASTVAQYAVDGSITAEAVTQKGIDVSTQSAANSAIKTIDTAINTVSKERSKLGAYQNRLEHTIANLGTSSENLTSSESRI